MTNINSAFYNYDETVEKSKTSYSGLLGLSIGGNRIVNHPTRAGYVYVRLRDNLSEVVQAFNDKVSPVYDFPVLIQRKGNRWYVLGRDDLRYESWGTSAPYLPRHGDQHSFNRDGGGGGDVTWVYPDQFMPLLVYPSGTYGASNLLIAPYVLQKADKFIYVGNTGTANIIRYKPTNSNAIVGLVYLDRDTGNPGFLINSGTPFAGTITGTTAILPYLPYPSSTQEPLYAFRLVSGTTSLTWSNLYNVRQLIGGSTSTGTSTSNHEALSGLLGGSANNHYHLTPSQVTGLVSGTSTTLHQHSGTFPAGSDTQIQYNDGGVAFGGSPLFLFNKANSLFELGGTDGGIGNIRLQGDTGNASSPNGDATIIHELAYGTTGNGPLFKGVYSRGNKATPVTVNAEDTLFRIRAGGYDGAGLMFDTASSGAIQFVANQNFTTTANGTRIDIYTTPDGSTTLTKTLTIGEGGLASDVTANKTLTLTATNNFTLTVPATGTAALLAVANQFTANQLIYTNGTPQLLFAINGDANSYSYIRENSANGLVINKTAATGTALIDVNPTPSDNTSAAGFRFFRSTNTSGAVSFDVHKGNNTATINCSFAGNGNSYVSLDSGNFGIGTNTYGTSAVKVLGIKNGTEPTTSPADTLQIYAVDLSAGNSTLGIRTETAVVSEAVTSDRTLSVRINGTTYKICLKA